MGKHRKPSRTNAAKGRMAVAAVATGAVSTAGMGGVAAASLGEGDTQQPSYQLASADATIGSAEPIAEAAPQILSISEHRPANDVAEQLNKAVQSNLDRLQADAASRLPAGSSAIPGLSSSGVATPAQGAFTSGFGTRWGAAHKGVDIANAIGTPILAAMAGTVIDAGPASGFGNWVRVQHDDGTVTVYGHVSTIDVSVGQHVAAGEKIAGMGNEGYSTGPHLHFEVHPAGSDAIDPLPWLAERGINL